MHVIRNGNNLHGNQKVSIISSFSCDKSSDSRLFTGNNIITNNL